MPSAVGKWWLALSAPILWGGGNPSNVLPSLAGVGTGETRSRTQGLGARRRYDVTGTPASRWYCWNSSSVISSAKLSPVS